MIKSVALARSASRSSHRSWSNLVHDQVAWTACCCARTYKRAFDSSEQHSIQNIYMNDVELLEGESDSSTFSCSRLMPAARHK